MDTILLIGADDVRSAGCTMRSAAEEMRRAVASLDDTASRQRQFLDDWLQRFSQVLEDNRL